MFDNDAVEGVVESQVPEEDVEGQLVRDLASGVLDALRGPKDTLSVGEREILDRLARVLMSLPDKAPAYARGLSERCLLLGEEHGSEHPARTARRILDRRCPQVRVLRDDDRQLRSSYGFDDYETPPAPLENLLVLAGLDWEDLKEAAAEAGNPALTTMLARGNRGLEERLHGSWRQSRVSVELSVNQGALNVHPYDVASDTHSLIEDRSDGFRSFLALLTFATRHSVTGRRLILAIDEAELHLHYNAQADLVRVLTGQTVATQIIYTTHSAGCLPEDLGSAIRVVRAIENDRSDIQNGFWSSEDAGGGFTALLMAMGAGAVAFTPARRAVLAEGPSDALLLPALLRAANGQGPDEPLGFQVAGGLAWTPPQLLGSLEGEAAHVVYLTDSDDTGKRYRRHLKDAGVESDRIFDLVAGSVRGVTIEDFVDKATYAEAFNLLMREFRGYDGKALSVRELPSTGLAKYAEKWARKRGLEAPSKTAIAEHLLSLSGTSLAYVYWAQGEVEVRPLLRRGREKALARLLQDVSVGLKLGS
ncbi:MAG TPA: AAA family ATPase [Thermoleophilaceae bacterium]|nr:AAA family ATPase [Thermoleophilaceae bacterium]